MVSVGWNHHVTIHPDIDNDEEEIQAPYPMWNADKENQGHTEEVTSITFGLPDLLATGKDHSLLRD